uniref:Uncharacterized protein n=1 Tax=Ralstonia solanacearum TaxID=305 RepID=A0A0S4X3L6_RALSL|nr:protein of unknown function [Ralstonia solanacearum]
MTQVFTKQRIGIESSQAKQLLKLYFGRLAAKPPMEGAIAIMLGSLLMSRLVVCKLPLK